MRAFLFLIITVSSGVLLQIGASEFSGLHRDGNRTVDSARKKFLNEELLSNPTTSSITISLIPSEEIQCVVEYGRSGSDESYSTSPRIVTGGEPAVFLLEGLRPDTRYFYRVKYRKPPSEIYTVRGEHSFKTLRTAHPTFSFAFASDSHIFLQWSKAICDNKNDGISYFGTTINNILFSGVDFLLIGGDEAQTHCFSCSPCYIDGEYTGFHSVQSQREAELRYRIMRSFYETLGHSIPVFLVLGNHDGEAGFGDGSCEHYDSTLFYSMNARLQHFPNPADTYSGGPDGNYYAFESGDALFVILDVMRYTTEYPQNPDDWTLGEEQLTWLEETLAGSDKKWKFLFAHHLVGGDYGVKCYQYGRGGIKTTDNGEANGTFLGEQAVIHQMMKDYGATIFFYGHDHIFISGEKLNADYEGEGIYYIAGGYSAGADSRWVENDRFGKLYDYDGDNEPDFYTEIGFVLVTVHGQSRVNLKYIISDYENPGDNGKVVFEQDIGVDNKQ